MAVPLSPSFAPALRIAAGVLILAGGVSLVVSARILFTRTGQNPIPWKPTPELILQGPYCFTRNPMYVGVTLLWSDLALG
jgi:protein-S-isoprenylcysteine O-methyltransferase Ste14